jgi:hypothetical protein
MTLADAIGHMITWVRSTFAGGQDWARRSDIGVRPTSRGYYLYLVLDKSGKFGLAARKFWDFCLRGEAKQGRRRTPRATYDQLEIRDLEQERS